jgi:hypothetical protein
MWTAYYGLVSCQHKKLNSFDRLKILRIVKLLTGSPERECQMKTHTRSLTQTAISVSMPNDLRDEIDLRAKSLGLNRSQYLARLAEADLAKGGPLTITPADPVTRILDDVLAGSLADTAAAKPGPGPARPVLRPTKTTTRGK